MPARRSRIAALLLVATAAALAAEMAGSVDIGGGRFDAAREGRTELMP